MRSRQSNHPSGSALRIVELYNSGMATHPDLLIIGGGIIGLTTAYFAAKAGLRVEVCDRGDLGREASWAGAGILPPGNVVHAATPIDKLRALGSEGMAAFADELRELTGIDNGYQRCGGIEFLQEEDRYALKLWESEQICYEFIDRERLHEIEPHVGDIAGDAYLLPECGQLRNPWHLRALIAACKQRGVALTTNQPVVGWRFDGPHVLGVGFADGSVHHAGRILVASGSWSESLLSPLGISPGVHPVLGQIILYRPRQAVLSRVLMLGKEYLVPRADGRVLVGSTEEPEAGFEKRTTTMAFERLNSLATKVVPALAQVEVEKQWAGLRPASRDGLPFLGEVPGTANVFVATGHFRAGVQLSLGTALVMTSLMMGERPLVELSEFRLDRTPTRPNPYKNAFRS